MSLQAAAFATAGLLLAGLACSPLALPSPPTPFQASPIPTFSPVPPSRTPAPSATPTEVTATTAGQIVYTCQLFAEGLYDQVCLIQPDGSGMIRLTSNDLADHFYPSLSPEGNSVLFSSNMAGPYEIYEQPLSGLPQRLTVQGENYAPAVSPDGSLVAYTHTDPEGSALWLMNRDGSQPHYLAGMAWDATWSPDGAWILHASDRSGSIQLWRIRPDGSQLTQVTQFDGLRGRNDWSSQGVLATYAGESWQREIITFDQSGENRQQITEGGNNLAPSFSPDGSWMVYTSYVDNYLDDNGCEIYAQHLSSRTRIRLTQNSYCDWQPRWGADPGD